MTLPVSESDQPVQAGPAIPAIEDESTPAAGAAVPVVIVSDVAARGQMTGDPIHVSFVTDRAVAAGSAVPIIMVGNTDLAYDLFTPDTDPLASTDDRTVIGTRWYSRDRMVYGGSAVGETAYGNSVIAQDDIERANGRIIQWVVRTEDAEAYLAIVAGSTPSSTDPVTDGYTWLWEFGRNVYGVPGQRVQIFDTHYAEQPKLYLITLLLFDRGAAFLRSTIGPEIAAWRVSPVPVPEYPETVVDYITYRGTQPTLTPYISARQSPNTGEALRGHQLMGYRVQDVPEWQALDPLASFADRFDGTGNLENGWTQQVGIWQRQNGAAICIGFGAGANYATHDSGMSDGNGLWLYRIKFPATGNMFAFCVLRQSGTEYIRLILEPTAWRLQAVAGGVFSHVITQTGYTPPRDVWIDILVMAQGTRYNVVIGDVPVQANWFEDTHPTAATYANHTGIGIGTFEANTFFDDVQAIPFVHTLPDAARNQSLPTGTQKTTLLQSFGAVPLTGSGNVVSVQDYGVHAVRVRSSIRMAATVGRFVFVGHCLACLDADNWFVVRLAADHDPVLGQADDEIEVMQRIGGVTVVVGKVQYPRMYLDNAVFVLDSQIERIRQTSWVHVWLDGDYVQSYPLPVELNAATKHGFYQNVTDDPGSQIESGAIYA